MQNAWPCTDEQNDTYRAIILSFHRLNICRGSGPKRTLSFLGLRSSRSACSPDLNLPHPYRDVSVSTVHFRIRNLVFVLIYPFSIKKIKTAAPKTVTAEIRRSCPLLQALHWLLERFLRRLLAFQRQLLLRNILLAKFTIFLILIQYGFLWILLLWDIRYKKKQQQQQKTAKSFKLHNNYEQTRKCFQRAEEILLSVSRAPARFKTSQSSSYCSCDMLGTISDSRPGKRKFASCQSSKPNLTTAIKYAA